MRTIFIQLIDCLRLSKIDKQVNKLRNVVESADSIEDVFKFSVSSSGLLAG